VSPPLQHGNGEVADIDGSAGGSVRARHFQVVALAARVSRCSGPAYCRPATFPQLSELQE
jgi:hypothetical protein